MPEIDLPFTPGHPRRNEPGSAWVQMDLTRLEQRDTYSWSLRAPAGQERLPVILFGSQPLLETMDDKVLEQIGNGAWLPGLVGAAVTMPDAHWGYGFPICYALSVDLESSPVADDQARRFDHPTTAKAVLDGAGRKQALIEVVMEHASEVLAVRARQRDRSVFHDPVADRVRVSQPLALDDLERLLAHRLARHSSTHTPATAQPAGVLQANSETTRRVIESDGRRPLLVSNDRPDLDGCGCPHDRDFDFYWTSGGADRKDLQSKLADTEGRLLTLDRVVGFSWRIVPP